MFSTLPNNREDRTSSSLGIYYRNENSLAKVSRGVEPISSCFKLLGLSTLVTKILLNILLLAVVFTLPLLASTVFNFLVKSKCRSR